MACPDDASRHRGVGTPSRMPVDLAAPAGRPRPRAGQGQRETMRIPERSDRTHGRRPRRAPSPVAVVGILVTLALLVLGACAGTPPTAGPSAQARALVPAPTDGVEPAASVNEGVEGGVPFVEFRSNEAPPDAADAYARQLSDAGFRVLQRKDGWTAWGTDRVTIWVNVSRTGPPTSIIVRYVPGEADATMLATMGASAIDPTATAGGPGASPSPITTAVNPATPQPATRPGGPFATPPGQGNRPTAKPTKAPPTAKPDPTPRPTATPKPTKKPHPTPQPTKTPKPTKSPKPTPPAKGNQP